MNNWIPLPFPKCPKCYESWSESYHKNCETNGQIEVEPYKELSRCRSCYKEWNLFKTRFFCSCGYSFDSNEVGDAIRKTLSLKKRLHQMLIDMDFDEQKIENISNESISSWLNKKSYEISNSLGKIAGKILKIISNMFK